MSFFLPGFFHFLLERAKHDESHLTFLFIVAVFNPKNSGSEAWKRPTQDVKKKPTKISEDKCVEGAEEEVVVVVVEEEEEEEGHCVFVLACEP